MNDQRRMSAAELLKPIAGEAWLPIFQIAKTLPRPSTEGSNIAVRLHLIHEGLSCLPPYQLNPEIHKLCSVVLQDLFAICTWSSSSPGTPKTTSLQHIYNTLATRSQTQSGQLNMDESVRSFLLQKATVIQSYQRRIESLSTKLDEINQTDSEQNMMSEQHLNPNEKDVYPDSVNWYLFNALRKYTTCYPPSHALPPCDMMKWHHTRISLSDGVLASNTFAQADIIIASQGMTLWQEISLSISLQIQDKLSGTDYMIDAFSDLDSEDEAGDCKELVQMKRGDVCQLLDENNYNKIHLLLDGSYRLHKYPDPECLQYFTLPGCGHSLAYVLCYGNLSIEHRILLAYTLARACWQFYNFDIVHENWTSDNVFFMPTDNQNGNQIPLRAFLSIPFDQVSRSLHEFQETGAYTHRYPRILFLGMMLLEIGLGESLGLGSLRTSKLSSVAYINRAHAKARMRLNEFKKISWNGFSYKTVFVEAIENCLDSQNFKETCKPQRKRAKSEASTRRRIEVMPALQQRRTALYRKVVAPLCWLAKVGFESSGEVPLITVKKSQRQKTAVVEDGEIRTFWNKVRAPTFDTYGPSARSGAWMNHLGVISGHVLRCRRQAKVTPRIRVAILDTGCHKDLPFFQREAISNCFTDWKDFADASQVPVDAFGHGTFMTRLLLQIAPIVDLSVVRVAVTQDQLSSSEESVVQAIEYAGLDWKADIISMSFNFPRSSTPISDVIDRVVKKRDNKVILLASAGNSASDRGEGFPARHPHVIAIYATDYQGTFLKSNPTRSGDGPRVLGTCGDNLPDSILEEMKSLFPGGDLSPGTSVATAIAAGIVAMMLSYSAALPVLVQAKLFEETLENLKTPKGMQSLLRVMSQNTDHRGDSVNPVRFWSEKSKDKEVFLAICKALAE